MTYCPLCETHILAGDEVELVLGMETHSACARMERRMARSTPGSRGYERAGGSQRSGALTAPSSDAGGAGRVSASSGVPRALATVGEGAGQRAPRPTAHTLFDDWDGIYGSVHDGLEPDELDIEVELEEFRDGFTRPDRIVVYGAAALLVVYLVGKAFGWWA